MKVPSNSGEISAAMPLSLRGNFSWIATGSAVEMACQWGVVVVLARLGDLGMVGTLVLAFAVCAPVNALAQLGLRGAVVTDARREYRFGDYLALRLVTAVIALAVVVGIVLTTGCGREMAWIILAIGLGELLKSISDIFHALMQQNERMDRIALALMLRGPLTLGWLALCVWLTGDLFWGVVGFPLIAAAVLFGFDLPNGARLVRGLRLSDATPSRSDLRPRWQPETLLRLARLTLPLGVVLSLIALTTSVPRYMVSHYLGNQALGVFVSIFYLAAVGTRVVIAVGQSAGPRLAKYHASENRAAYCRLLGKMLAIVAGMGTAVVLLVATVGGPLLQLLYDAEFGVHARLAVYLMGAAAVMYLTIPLGIALEAMRRFKTHMVIRGVGILVLLILLPELLERFGLQGAAAAIAVSSACCVLGCVGAIAQGLIAQGLSAAGECSVVGLPVKKTSVEAAI